MPFLSDKLILGYIPETNMWVTNGVVVFWGKSTWNKNVAVPVGFETDFASVPWPAVMFIPKSGRYNSAAIVHDYLYSKQGKLEDGRVFTRAQVDKVFLEAMTDLGVNWFKRNIMYRAVRFGGGIPWKKV